MRDVACHGWVRETGKEGIIVYVLAGGSNILIPVVLCQHSSPLDS
jgi:hypothetical protein